MSIHEVFSGNTTNQRRLFYASMFALLWFSMDVIQFADWAVEKFNPSCSIKIPYGVPTTQGTIVPAVGSK
jgi:hypothetical protein